MHYIEGKGPFKKALKLSVNACKFEYDLKSSVNNELVNEKLKNQKAVLNELGIVFCLILGAIVFVTFVILQIKKKQSNDEDMSLQEMMNQSEDIENP